MPLLFCNIAWMEYYGGRDPKDPPKGGGGFPRTQGYCGEELNFVGCEDGYVYGHFETIKGDVDRQVNIERLGAQRREDFLDGVDVVWTAPIEGNDPRCVVGWYKNARLYRFRQKFQGLYPSERHEKDEIDSFRVRAKIEDAFLLPLKERDEKLTLGRGPGWSGQASWWYAEDTENTEARRFVRSIRNLINGGAALSGNKPKGGRKKGRAGEAAANEYTRYVLEYEAVVSPRHSQLQKRFEVYLKKTVPGVNFPPSFRDDLRYVDAKGRATMAEIKPTEPSTVRFAIRAAIGQLLDYRQHQQWPERQLIVVETEVTSADDKALALENGFGLAWPSDGSGFTIVWPR
ncbi:MULTISPECIES: hypothetical protein [Rhizobium]|uniref:Uncharacterized protein n=1 Tax=Rhizobium leguminosarum bv. viciae TaxID=387 RepID=A0A8G2MN89_RHILV|nr:hypothetical protein [Rhizobium leguminosarum]NKK10326.1 hypothetical protein [Rhizobium leguminosarum bv. viciae]NKK23480.1 hypothetical protein [Rhizobium leguminosarum bv. viciae]TBX87937.1 hypothetical protein E0H31_27275 [Rhizobium leguminosarum bv. viciae]TBZ13110.1 hypothetical protein E0H52_27350 [Rhizobium leguminosarum bv. viciae]